MTSQISTRLRRSRQQVSNPVSLLSMCKLTQHAETIRKNVWEKSNDVYLFTIRVKTRKNHISICFLPQYQRQRKCFSSERELKKSLHDTLTRAAWSGLPVSQRYVIKQMVNAIACTIELWVHLGGLLSTQEARVALGYRLVRLLRFFRA